MSPQLTSDPRTFEHRAGGLVFDAFTLDGEEVWTGEDGGRIRYRDPSTGDWHFQETPFEVRGIVRRIHFLDNALDGWAVTSEGYVLRTTDGGFGGWKALARMPVDPAIQAHFDDKWEDLYDIWIMPDATLGWLVGLRGIYRTTNGGICWERADMSGDPHRFHDPQYFWLYTVELYAIDVRMGSPSSAPDPCPDPNSFAIYVVGQPGVIFRSLDGIHFAAIFNWEDLCDLVDPSSCLAHTQWCHAETEGPWWELWDVEIGRNSSGPLILIVGGVGIGCGLVLSSTDEGCTWELELHECEAPGADCANDPEYDETLPPHRHDEFKTLYGVGIRPSDNRAIAAGYNGQQLFREWDGNRFVWRDRSEFGKPVDWPDVLLYPLFGATIPPYPPVGQAEKFWMTGLGGHIRYSDTAGEDGGPDRPAWTEVGFGEPFRLQGAWFKPADTPGLEDLGFTIGQNARIGFSEDGGTSFTTSEPGILTQNLTLRAICFAGDNLHGVIVGDPLSPPHGSGLQILYTNDYGADAGWRQINPADITYASGVDPSTHLSTSLLSACWAKDSQNLQFWTVGQKGLVLQSLDGGQSWTQHLLPFSNHLEVVLNGVSASSPGAVVAVGSIPDGTGHRGLAVAWNGTSWSELAIDAPGNGTVERLRDVVAQGSHLYAVGMRRPLDPEDEERTGLVLRYDLQAQKFVAFPGPVAPDELRGCGIVGAGMNHVVLTQIDRTSNGDLWIAGACGMVWQHQHASSSWIEHKSQTNADVRDIQFTSPGRGYFAAHGGSGAETNQVLVRYRED